MRKSPDDCGRRGKQRMRVEVRERDGKEERGEDQKTGMRNRRDGRHRERHGGGGVGGNGMRNRKIH